MAGSAVDGTVHTLERRTTVDSAHSTLFTLQNTMTLTNVLKCHQLTSQKPRSLPVPFYSTAHSSYKRQQCGNGLLIRVSEPPVEKVRTARCFFKE